MKKILATATALLLMGCAASAATLISTASGNINATGTWSLVDTTGANAFLNSETANTALTTSPVASSTFTPAAETLTEVGVKIASVAAAPSGTMTIKLANSTSPGSRECTLTVNVADLPSASAATAEGGFIFLACAASPNGTDSYTITANTSVAAQINLFSLATTNWSRALVTSGTQASGPAAGDQFFVNGVLTGAGTHTAYTVTVNTTANINYGSSACGTGVACLVNPSIGIGQWGTLASGTTTATNYAMEFAGPMVIYNGGTFDIGTTGTPVPMSSSCTATTACATLTLNSTTQGDTGITNRNGGTLATNGAPRNAATCSSGMACIQTHLSSNISAGAISSIPVVDNTGWQSGDKVVIAATGKIAGGNLFQSEQLTLTGNATSGALPVSATLSFAHLGQTVSYVSTNNGISYSMPESAEVVLLTRNVRIIGASLTQGGYIYCAPLANCALAWTEFQWISGKNSGQYAIDSDTIPGGTFSLTYSSLHDSHDGGIVVADTQTNWGGTVASPVTIQYVTLYNVAQTNDPFPAGNAIAMNSFIKNPNWIFDNVTVLTVQNNNNGIFLRAVAGQFSYIVIADVVGSSATGALVTQTPTPGTGLRLGNWGPLYFHSNFNFDTSWQANSVHGTINGVYTFHSYGFFLSANGDNLVFDPMYGLGNGVFQAGIKSNSAMTLKNGFLANDAVSGPRPPFGTDEDFINIEFDNMELCPTQTTNVGSILTTCSGTNSATSVTPVNDIGVASSGPTTTKVIGRNTSFLSSADQALPGLLGETFMTNDSFVCSDWINNHECFLTYGVVTYDTAIEHTTSVPTSRLTPIVTRFTASSAGTTLTVAGSPAPYPAVSVTPNLFILGTTTPALSGTEIINVGTGIGGAGTYTLNNSQTFASQVMTGSATGANCSTIPSPCRMPSAPLYKGMKVAVASGNTVQVCAWVRESQVGDTSGVAYNGDAPRLIERVNPQMGINSDVVLATYSGSGWQQLCGTSATAPGAGEFEFIVDADMTSTSNAGGWVNVGDWSVAGNSVNPNGTSTYNFNGVAADLTVPNTGSGGGIIGGN